MDQRAAHTAEHAFVGSLQRVLGHPLKVRKVEHSPDGTTTAHIVIASLNPDQVIEAEKITNSLILEGRAVRTQVYGSLDEARSANAGLRANEERISGSVRVVYIEGHDVAACSMDHAENLSECDFFLVSRIAKSASEYEIDFVIGKQARISAVDISGSFHRICTELAASPKTVEPTARKLKAELAVCESRLRALSSAVLQQIQARTLGGDAPERIEAYSAVLSHLSDEKVVEYAGEKISRSGIAALVCVANVSGEAARVVLAISEPASEKVNLNQLFRKHSAGFGKGGGRPHFVTGVLPRDRAQSFVDGILSEFSKGLYIRVG